MPLILDIGLILLTLIDVLSHFSVVLVLLRDLLFLIPHARICLLGHLLPLIYQLNSAFIDVVSDLKVGMSGQLDTSTPQRVVISCHLLALRSKRFLLLVHHGHLLSTLDDRILVVLFGTFIIIVRLGHLLALTSVILDQDRSTAGVVGVSWLRNLGHLLSLVLKANTVLLGFLMDRSLIGLDHAVHLLKPRDLGLIFDAQPEVFDQLLHFGQLALELQIGLLGRLESSLSESDDLLVLHRCLGLAQSLF